MGALCHGGAGSHTVFGCIRMQIQPNIICYFRKGCAEYIYFSIFSYFYKNAYIIIAGNRQKWEKTKNKK